jgi:hypothetical protein
VGLAVREFEHSKASCEKALARLASTLIREQLLEGRWVRRVLPCREWLRLPADAVHYAVAHIAHFQGAVRLAMRVSRAQSRPVGWCRDASEASDRDEHWAIRRVEEPWRRR